MKKSLLIVSLVLTSASVFGQVKLGAKVGGGVSGFIWDTSLENIEKDRKWSNFSYLIGGFAEFPLVGKLSGRTELLFQRKGEDRIKFNCLSLPVLAEYEVIKNLKLEAGLEPSFKVLDISTPIEFKKWDLVADFGLSYDILKLINLGFRYNLGLIQISDLPIMGSDDNGQWIDDLYFRNYSYMVMVNYTLK